MFMRRKLFVWRLLCGTNWRSERPGCRRRPILLLNSRWVMDSTCSLVFDVFHRADSVVTPECEWAKQCMGRMTPYYPLWFFLFDVCLSVTDFSQNWLIGFFWSFAWSLVSMKAQKSQSPIFQIKILFAKVWVKWSQMTQNWCFPSFDEHLVDWFVLFIVENEGYYVPLSCCKNCMSEKSGSRDMERKGQKWAMHWENRVQNGRLTIDLLLGSSNLDKTFRKCSWYI